MNNYLEDAYKTDGSTIWLCVTDPDQFMQLMMEGNLVAEVGMIVLDTLSLYTQQFKVQLSVRILPVWLSVRILPVWPSVRILSV